MKLSKLFHTLYATVMALPVIIIPIFAININQKSVEPISIEVQEQISVDFNQYVNVTNLSTTSNGITFDVVDNTIHAYGTSTGNSYLQLSNLNINNAHHKFVLRTDGLDNGTTSTYFACAVNSGGGRIDASYTTSSSLFTPPGNYNVQRVWLWINSGLTVDFYCSVNLFDLTQMYGIDNEPSLQEFNNTFTLNYYPYTESQKMLVDKPTPTTYDDTDIGSQFLYSLYKPVQDYFNFGEFFGLGGMYDWFQLNIFNGTAPISFFIIFNVMIYWLFISLFWLIFDILIYVPMVIHKWLDKAEM